MLGLPDEGSNVRPARVVDQATEARVGAERVRAARQQGQVDGGAPQGRDVSETLRRRAAGLAYKRSVLRKLPKGKFNLSQFLSICDHRTKENLRLLVLERREGVEVVRSCSLHELLVQSGLTPPAVGQ